MNSYIIEFIDYLSYIGFLSNQSKENYIKIYNKNLDNINNNINKNNLDDFKIEQNICDIIINSLFEFFNNLNNDTLKEICKSLFNKFNENKLKLKINYLKKIFRTHKNKEKKIYFEKWKNGIDLNKKNNFFNFQNNNSHTPSSIQKKFNDDKILTKSNTYYNIYNLNYNQKKKKKLKNFIQRQENYSKKKIHNQEKQFQRSEEELDLLCSFSPKLNKNINVKSKIKNRSVKYKTPKPNLPIFYISSRNMNKNNNNNINNNNNNKIYSNENKNELNNIYILSDNIKKYENNDEFSFVNEYLTNKKNNNKIINYNIPSTTTNTNRLYKPNYNYDQLLNEYNSD